LLALAGLARGLLGGELLQRVAGLQRIPLGLLFPFALLAPGAFGLGFGRLILLGFGDALAVGHGLELAGEAGAELGREALEGLGGEGPYERLQLVDAGQHRAGGGDGLAVAVAAEPELADVALVAGAEKAAQEVDDALAEGANGVAEPLPPARGFDLGILCHDVPNHGSARVQGSALHSASWRRGMGSVESIPKSQSKWAGG